MNTYSIIALFIVCSSACAELPPVSGNNSEASPNSAVAVKPPAAAMSDYEIMKRVEQLQKEVQQLTGKVEEQTYQLDELKKRQKTMYSDFDERLQALENKSGISPISQPSAETPAEPSGSDVSSGTKEPATPPVAAEVKPSSENTVEKQPNSTPDAPANSTAPTQVVPVPVAPGAAQISGAEKQEYQQAYDDLRKGKTTEAITGLNAYIAAHPESTYISNAHYWLGEAHRVNHDNVSARKAFNSVIEKYPTSEKVPDSLLKLGYIDKDEKNITKAREYLMQVIKEYPNSKAAKIAQKKLPMLEKAEATH